MRRLLAWILGEALLLSLFLPSLVLLSRAAAYGDWAKTHNRERYRGTAITSVERRLYTAPAADLTTSVRTLARELTAELPDDTARLAAIYNWVCDNIAYDYDYFEGRTDTTGEAAGEVLSLGRGVCVGYSDLAAQLCRVAGIPCKTVNGYQLGAGEAWGEEHTELESWEANHVWNEAYVGGRWVIFDTTWGSANTYRDGVTTTGTTSPAQLDITPETLADTRLNIDYISDGTCTYDQAADGSLTLNAPLDEGINEVVIPATVSGRPVVAVGVAAFEGCESLTRVTLPSSVTALADRAFSYTGLTATPDLSHVTQPGDSLFAYCAALTTATLPAHWTEIPRDIFSQCPNLESVTLPPNILAVGIRAFNGCEKIDSFPFADGLKTIGKEAFAGSGLTAAHLPDSVTELGDGAFAGCRQLAALTLPRGLTTIPPELAMECPQLTAVDIPAGVTFISHHAFQGSGLRSVVLPDGVYTIREATFDSCAQLTSVRLPDGLQSIDTAAFRGCGFETLELPASLTVIGERAFENCGELTEIHFPEQTSRILKQAFRGCMKLQAVHLPLYTEIVGEGAFAGCENLKAFTVDEKNESLAAEEGVLYTRSPYTLLAYPAARPDASYTVPAGVERIGAGAFQNARYLRELRVEAALVGEDAFGENAFFGATGLQKVAFATGTTAIPAYCFSGTGLTHITLPDTLQTLNLEAFAGCELKELEMPAAVETFLPGNVALEQLTVHKDNGVYYDRDGVLFRWGDRALLWYPKGRADPAYTVPAGTQRIEDQAFSQCRALETVTLPEGLQSIGDGVFWESSLGQISLPASLLEVGDAFLYTPWWEAQEPGPVYLDHILYGIRVEEEFGEEELVVREGTRVITELALSECYDLKRLVIPASVVHIGDYWVNKNIIIVGERGTAAEKYAQKRRYTFETLSTGNATTTHPTQPNPAVQSGMGKWLLVGLGGVAIAAAVAWILYRKRVPKT